MIFKKYIKHLPTIVIFSSVVVSFLSNFIDFNYVLVGNVIGYSILWNLVIIYFLKRLKYCVHTIIAMCNLTVLNIFNILNSYDVIDYKSYNLTYDGLTLLIMFLTMFIYSAKK